MSSPKHLWSGDWQADSEAAAEELAALRGAPRPSPVEEDEPPAEQARTAPPRRVRRTRRPPPQLKVALALALGALVVAGVGYGLTSALGTSKSRAPVGSGYLGLQIGSRALMGGLLINGVDSGSPAQRAGIRRGDVLARIGQIEVHTPGDVRALLQGRLPGDQLQLEIERGSLTFTVDVTLARRP